MIRNAEMLGKVQTEYFGKPIVFDGIRMGNCAPTDCDALIEYHNKAYLFFEYKFRNSEMPVGQELAFTRIIDDLASTGKTAALFECHHYEDTGKKTGTINGAHALVTKIYMDKKWIQLEHPKPVTEMTARFRAWVDNERC